MRLIAFATLRAWCVLVYLGQISEENKGEKYIYIYTNESVRFHNCLSRWQFSISGCVSWPSRSISGASSSFALTIAYLSRTGSDLAARPGSSTSKKVHTPRETRENSEEISFVPLFPTPYRDVYDSNAAFSIDESRGFFLPPPPPLAADGGPSFTILLQTTGQYCQQLMHYSYNQTHCQWLATRDRSQMALKHECPRPSDPAGDFFNYFLGYHFTFKCVCA